MNRFLRFLVFTTLLLVTATQLHAGAVSGKFLTNRGNIIKSHISIKGQPPQSIIIEQRIAKGTNVLSTKPPAQKISSGKGSVKWLFKKPSSGDIILTMKVSPPLSKKPRGILRFVNPATGQNEEVRY